MFQGETFFGVKIHFKGGLFLPNDVNFKYDILHIHL